MLSISTCWNSSRHTDGAAMLQELCDLGFERVELGHGIRLSLMEGILKFAEKKAGTNFAFSSLHNFCPLPVEVPKASPDCFQFSSHREEERARAIKLTHQTIDYAERLGAPRVVLHLGSIPMNPITAELLGMIANGELYSRRYTQKKLKAVQTREAKSAFYMNRVRQCIEPIVEYAAEKNIQLGIESRHSYEEIPSSREIPPLLDALNSPNAGYWHDFGHVQVKHNLGFLDHEQWLTAIAPRLIGCHLHDTAWPGGDHRVPFSGSIPYEKLIPILPKNCLLVWEMSPRRKTEEITQALELWKKRFGA